MAESAVSGTPPHDASPAVSSNQHLLEHLKKWYPTICLPALDNIASACLKRLYPDIALPAARMLIGGGASAAVYRYTVARAGADKPVTLVARVIYPWRPRLRTEAEVGAMKLVRARTRVPVPEVYQYCSVPDNPVGSEWILMEYMPGVRLCDVFDSPEFTLDHKLRLAHDVVQAWSEIFNITASHIGSILPLPNEDGLALSAIRYPILYQTAQEWRQPSPCTCKTAYAFGPLNDLSFFGPKLMHMASAEQCGPFKDEREMLSAIAFQGNPPTRPNTRNERGPGEKILELAGRWRSWPAHTSICGSTPLQFHLSHGDFMARNMIVCPKRGALVGVVDWECAAFLPDWLAASAPDCFNDDEDRCIMGDEQEQPRDFVRQDEDEELSVHQADVIDKDEEHSVHLPDTINEDEGHSVHRPDTIDEDEDQEHSGEFVFVPRPDIIDKNPEQQHDTMAEDQDPLCDLVDRSDMVEDHEQPGHDKAKEELPDPATAYLQAFFRRTLECTNPTLFSSYWGGVEMRALKTALSHPNPENAKRWLSNYAAFVTNSDRKKRFWRVDCVEVMGAAEVLAWKQSEANIP